MMPGSRGAWLTWKMHRFEVAFVVAGGLLAMISALVVTAHLRGAGMDASCWPRTEEGGWPSDGCEAAQMRFSDLYFGGEAGYLRIVLGLFAPVAGILLAEAVVAREVELRTTALAWSLEGLRWRWLVSRVLPMLAVGVAAWIALGLVGQQFFSAVALGYPHSPQEIHEVGSSGIAMVARGVGAFGIALLVGALVGRTLPAFMVAGVVVVLWFAGGVGQVQAILSDRFAIWERDADERSWQTGEPGPIAYVDSGNFDTSATGVNGEPGARFDYDALDRAVMAACGPYPDEDSEQETEAQRTWAACSDPMWEVANDTGWNKQVPGARFPDYVLADTIGSLAVGGLAILLTFPVVARRRP